MTSSVVLAVVLGVALLGCVAALIITELRAAARRRSALPPAVAGEEALDSVDLGLRRLVGACSQAGRPLPDVYAAVWSGERLTLRLADTDRQAPAPWTPDEAGDAWSLEHLGAPNPGLPAHPYALTVTLGIADGERVLVNLSRATSAIAVTGAEDDVLDVVRAMVSEALTGAVGRLAEVTLVGPEVTANITARLGFRSARLHTAATLAEALSRGAAVPAAAPSAPGVTQVFQLIEGAKAPAGNPLLPRLFVVAAAQFARERSSAAGLGESDALLVVGDTPDASWRLRTAPDGSLTTGALGLTVTAHIARLG